MAVVRSTTGTVEQSTDVTIPDPGAAVTGTFDAGSDANRYLTLTVVFDGSNGHTVGDAAVTFNGDPMTPMAATTSQSNTRQRSFELVNPDSGSHDWSVTFGDGIAAGAAIVVVHCYSGVDQDTPSSDFTSANGADASAPLDSTVTVPSAAGDMVHVVHGVRQNGIASGSATGFTERTDNVFDSGTIDVGAVSGNEPGAASVATTVTWSGPASINWIAHGWNINAGGAAASAALTGTITSATVESDIVSGGKTIILTLTNDTWVASGATFDAQRQNIIDGLDSAQSEATGWNAEVRDNEAVTAVVRTSDTIVTITLSAAAAYAITDNETVTATIPATALTGAGAIVASPTFTITNETPAGGAAGTSAFRRLVVRPVRVR